MNSLGAATQAAWASGQAKQALANAVPYMQAFGHTVLAWIWLDVALAALAHDSQQTLAQTQGKLRATSFFTTMNCQKLAPGWQWSVRATRPVPKCLRLLFRRRQSPAGF